MAIWFERCKQPTIPSFFGLLGQTQRPALAKYPTPTAFAQYTELFAPNHTQNLLTK